MNGNQSSTNNLNTKNGYWSKNQTYQQEMSSAALSPSCNWRKAAPTALMDTETVTETPRTSFAPPTPTTLENSSYMAGLLSTLTGEKVRVQFLIGTTGPLLDLVGTLVRVGANYIAIQPIETDDLTICDLYSVKFVTVLR